MNKIILCLSILLGASLASSQENLITISGQHGGCSNLLAKAKSHLRSQRVSFLVNSECRYCSGCTITKRAQIQVFNARSSVVKVSGKYSDCDNTIRRNLKSLANQGLFAFQAQQCNYCKGCTATKRGSIAVIESRTRPNRPRPGRRRGPRGRRNP